MADPNDDTGGAGDAAAIAAAAETTRINGLVEAELTKRLPDAVAKAMPKAPEKYELKAPDGVADAQAVIDAVAARAKALGLSNDAAQKLLTNTLEDRSTFHTNVRGQLAKTVAKWEDEVKADEILGGKDGSKVAATRLITDKVLDKFGTPALKESLSKSGYGSHPELVRLMYKIGMAMKEDTILGDANADTSGAKKPRTPEERAARMFPSAGKQAAAGS